MPETLVHAVMMDGPVTTEPLTSNKKRSYVGSSESGRNLVPWLQGTTGAVLIWSGLTEMHSEKYINIQEITYVGAKICGR